MSNPEQEDSFIPEGHAPFPSIYQDESQVQNYSLWATEALNDRYAQYTEFLKEKQMPRAIESSHRILAHIVFELMYRDGLFNKEGE